jgi:hypothetical protein
MRAILLAAALATAVGCSGPTPATSPEPRTKTDVIVKKDGSKITVTKAVD